MPTEFKLPELGENIESGQIVAVLVSEGDRIEKDQPVVEIETDKASVEVPASVAGTVAAIRVAEGDEINVGDVVLLIEEAGGAEDAASQEAETQAEESAEQPADQEGGEEEPAEDEPADQENREAARDDEEAAEGEPPEEEIAAEEPEEEEPEQEPEGEGSEEEAAAEEASEEEPDNRPVPFRPRGEPKRPPAPASPAVRRLARELGVDIHQVRGSGEKGRIHRDDVKAHVKSVMRAGGGAVPAPAAGPRPVELPDFEKWGEIEREPIGKVRETIARNLSRSWSQVVHVTHHDEADVTELEELREAYASKAEERGGKLTVTAILLKVVAMALERFPRINASLDMEAGEIVLKKYVHIGVAVDTDRGLLVPVIRDVDRKSILDLSVELGEVARKAREKKLSVEEMRGGSFTVTNLGGIGGTSFTPIVNYPEAAILGVSRTMTEPRWMGEQFAPRKILPLSLSYDHRLIDGADAARFVRWICDAVEKPLLTVLEEAE